MMNALENLSKVKRIIVWDRKKIGWIEYKKKGLFKKKNIICFFSTIDSFWDRDFSSEERFKSFLEEDHLILEDNEVFECWSIDLIYSYRCSRTIYFNSKTAQNDWLRSHSNNFISIENEE